MALLGEAPVALVVGGKGGIGSAIVKELSSKGWDVLTMDIHPEGDDLEIRVDLSDEAAVVDSFNRFRMRRERLDGLVFAAGIWRDRISWKLTAEDWDTVQSVNLRGAFLATKEATPLLRKSPRGRLLFVGSINGARGKVGQAAYCASKAGLEGLMKTLARELGRDGITSNLLAPGLIATPPTLSLPSEVWENAEKERLLSQAGTPEDVAAMAGFLLSKEGGFITGQVINVDGGQGL